MSEHLGFTVGKDDDPNWYVHVNTLYLDLSNGLWYVLIIQNMETKICSTRNPEKVSKRKGKNIKCKCHVDLSTETPSRNTIAK